jgi:hypothetical protein
MAANDMAEQDTRADHIGGDEFDRFVNPSVDMVPPQNISAQLRRTPGPTQKPHGGLSSASSSGIDVNYQP